jgi:hypothetical protein
MASKTTKLTSPQGATVSVDSSKVEGLLGRGFTQESTSSTKTTAKKASSSKTSK